MDAFDSDVVIYAADRGHPLGDRIRQLILSASYGHNVGSALLEPEVLIKPHRMGRPAEVADLSQLLARLRLHDADRRTTQAAMKLGILYGLRTVDSVHLATAVLAGADRFITNNRRDFGKDIAEIDIVYPDELPGGASPAESAR